MSNDLSEYGEGQRPTRKQECVKGPKWLGQLKRLAIGLWTSQKSLAHSVLSSEVRLLNLGKRAQSQGLYSPADVNEAAAQYSANCGPASFAAITRRPVSEVMEFFEQFPEKPWTSRSQMRNALTSANLDWHECGAELPNIGLALVQLIGPWSKPGIHPGASLSRTHWIAVVHGAFYDINWEGWLPQDVWERLIFVALRNQYSGCSGWDVRVGFEVVQRSVARDHSEKPSDDRSRKVVDLQIA